MVNDLKTRNNINSKNKTSKNKNVSVIIKDFIIKEIKGWELLTLLQQWGSLMTPYTKFVMDKPFLKTLRQFLV